MKSPSNFCEDYRYMLVLSANTLMQISKSADCWLKDIYFGGYVSSPSFHSRDLGELHSRQHDRTVCAVHAFATELLVLIN